nr:MAG TPA: beta-galactosidase [Caudoviricetes sp.]
MSIYDISASRLSRAFDIGGSRLSRAYALDGSLLWSAHETETFAFSGSQIPWSGWKFHKVSDTADLSYTSTAEAVPGFDDSAWQSVTVPHDWSIYNNFNADSQATYEGGYLDGGDAWYRCKFTIDDAMLSDQTLLYFDGVYMEATVYLNGRLVGRNYHGYNPFWLDISNILVEGENMLAVFVRNRQPSSRWYSGSGIYRPVYLLTMEGAGKWVTNVAVTSPELESQHTVSVATHIAFTVHNTDTATSGTAKVTIYKDGVQVAQNSKDAAIGEGETACSIDLSVTAPALWDVGQPNLYEAEITITGSFGSYTAPRVVYGYRWTKWDVDTGFWLNGKNIKLKGVCMHHDLGCIGAEANQSAMERQIDSMVQMGANAIRLTHNPSSTMFLDLCMRKGVLVVEELFDHWTVAKSKYDFARFYTDHYKEVVRDTLLRDRNDPAIIMWSLGNEINRTAKYTAEQVRPIVTALIAEVKQYDTTRPVTMGEDSPNMDAAKVCMELLDVCGINYNSNNLSVPHDMGKPSYGSETTSALASRGIYARDDTGYQCSSLDDDKVNWGSYAAIALQAHMDNAYSGGMFVWTGWDYIGEPTPFNKYPAKSSYFGIVDLAGFPKDIYYMYQSRWTDKQMIHIFPRDLDSVEDGKTQRISVYSNCPTVELFVNGVSIGKQTQAQIAEKYQFRWWPTFHPGTITAKGYDADGAVVATDEVKTSDGIPAQLALTAYKATVDVTTDDLVFVTCEVQDKDGVPVPTASNAVTFTCTGGTVLGTDNGNAACVEPMRRLIKSAFSGKVLCVCRHDGQAGNLVVTATAQGLSAGRTKIKKV